jgi:predicted negative regulator of RcsB-dependent stress response
MTKKEIINKLIIFTFLFFFFKNIKSENENSIFFKFVEGQENLKNKKFEKSIEIFQELSKSENKDISFMSKFYLAISFLEKRDLIKSEEIFLEILKNNLSDSDNFIVKISLAKIKIFQKKKYEAFSFLKQILKKNLDHIDLEILKNLFFEFESVEDLIFIYENFEKLSEEIKNLIIFCIKNFPFEKQNFHVCNQFFKKNLIKIEKKFQKISKKNIYNILVILEDFDLEKKKEIKNSIFNAIYFCSYQNDQSKKLNFIFFETKDNTILEDFLKKEEMKNLDFIISFSETRITKKISEFSKKNKIILFDLFSKDFNSIKDRNNFHYLLNSTNQTKLSHILEFFKKKITPNSLISIVYSEKNNEIEFNELKNYLEENNCKVNLLKLNKEKASNFINDFLKCRKKKEDFCSEIELLRCSNFILIFCQEQFIVNVVLNILNILKTENTNIILDQDVLYYKSLKIEDLLDLKASYLVYDQINFSQKTIDFFQKIEKDKNIKVDKYFIKTYCFIDFLSKILDKENNLEILNEEEINFEFYSSIKFIHFIDNQSYTFYTLDRNGYRKISD